MTVNSRDEELALGGGWANSPAAFDVYKNPAKARPQEPNPLKWVDQWPPTLHSSKNQRKIGAILLKAHGEFWKSPEYPSATADCMRQAFDGIARVLFDDGLLSETILLNDVADLVWDSAIAGGWWHLASETQIDIFPHKKSHYWVWFDETRDWPTLFRGAMAEWAAKLLEIEAPDTENGAELPRAGILASTACQRHLASLRARVRKMLNRVIPLKSGCNDSCKNIQVRPMRTLNFLLACTHQNSKAGGTKN